jgi:PKD repeat protein
MKYWYVAFLIFIYSTLLAQGEANNWYFGSNAGLSFTSGSPVAITNGQLNTDEGCASISNSSGQLLFYTDGITLFNRNHQIMLNGASLLGNSSTTQSATIVPKPGSTTLYYVFTIDAEARPNGFCYSIVDMALDSGFGGVTSEKNILIYAPTCEKIGVVKHANNVDFWIVTHVFGNNAFLAYSLTNSGFSLSPTVSNVGFSPMSPIISTDSRASSRGYMKISPNGSKIAIAHTDDGWGIQGVLQLLDFDNITGLIANPVTLRQESGELYGVEFSPNSQVLYFTNFSYFSIIQYDLTSSDIINSAITLQDISNAQAAVGALQIGPDNKIYLAHSNWNKIGVISNPDVIGIGCNLQLNAIDLAGKICRGGLPSFNQSFFFSPSINVTSNCVGDPSVFNFVTNQTVVSATWDFGDGSTSSSLSPSHTYANPGTYNVSVSVVTPFGTGTKNTTITIFAKPTLLADTVSLKQCDDNNDGFSAFNLNQITPSLVANATGLTITFHEELLQAQEDTGAIVTTTAYSNAIVSNDVIYARVENENGCYKTAQINLHVATTSIPTSFQITKIACDDLASGSNTDGIASFDFSDATTQIQALYPAGQQLIVTFYENLTDALAEQNAITNTSNYSNISYPNSQNIYVRIDSQINNECLGLGHHITLNVERIPIVQPLTLKHCDDNHDGIFDFDTTHLQSLLLNGLTNVEVSYTDQNGLPLTSPLPNPFITTSQTLTALVKNNFGNHCDYTTTVQFVVDDLPVATSINTNDITFCSNQNTVSVDTTTFEATILGSQTGMIVNYVDANTNSLSSPLPNPFVTPQQTISAQVINTANATCKTTVAIPIVIHSLPNISLMN